MQALFAPFAKLVAMTLMRRADSWLDKLPTALAEPKNGKKALKSASRALDGFAKYIGKIIKDLLE